MTQEPDRIDLDLLSDINAVLGAPEYEAALHLLADLGRGTGNTRAVMELAQRIGAIIIVDTVHTKENLRLDGSGVPVLALIEAAPRRLADRPTGPFLMDNSVWSPIAKMSTRQRELLRRAALRLAALEGQKRQLRTALARTDVIVAKYGALLHDLWDHLVPRDEDGRQDPGDSEVLRRLQETLLRR